MPFICCMHHSLMVELMLQNGTTKGEMSRWAMNSPNGMSFSHCRGSSSSGRLAGKAGGGRPG